MMNQPHFLSGNGLYKAPKIRGLCRGVYQITRIGKLNTAMNISMRMELVYENATRSFQCQHCECSHSQYEWYILYIIFWNCSIGNIRHQNRQNLMFQRTAVKTLWNGNARALDLEPRQGRGLEHFDVTPMVAVTAVVCNDEAEKNARFQRRRRANRPMQPMQGATGSIHELYSLDKKLGASSKSFCCIQDFLSSAGESIAVCWMRGAAHEVQSVWVLHTGSEPAQMRTIPPWLVWLRAVQIELVCWWLVVSNIFSNFPASHRDADPWQAYFGKGGLNQLLGCFGRGDQHCEGTMNIDQPVEGMGIHWIHAGYSIFKEIHVNDGAQCDERCWNARVIESDKEHHTQ